MSAVSAPLDRPARAHPTSEATRSIGAARYRRPGWRDPRVVVGVLLVCLSVVLGAALLSAEEEMSVVWSTRTAIAAGESIGPDDVRTTRVRFADPGDTTRYVTAEDPLEASIVATRDVAAGELLPVAAVKAGEAELAELPLAAQGGGVPLALTTGDRVDVWTVPLTRGATQVPRGREVLSDVPVLRVGPGGLAGPEGTRQVVVGVPEDLELGAAVGRLADSHVVLVRRP